MTSPDPGLLLDDPLFKAFADPTRLALVRALALGGPSDIATLAEGFPQDRSVISRHLKVLQEAGVVGSSKEGRHVRYSLDGPALVGRFEALLATAKAVVEACCP